ncbi:MAG: choice-of-anchor D domain-containing protein, partial [Blastocatellia bacterium]
MPGCVLLVQLLFSVAVAQTPRIFVSPMPHLNFCSVAVGASADQTVTVYNAGSAPLNVTSLNIPSDPAVPTVFSVVSPSAPFTLAPGNQQSVVVRFRPAYAVTQGIIP